MRHLIETQIEFTVNRPVRFTDRPFYEFKIEPSLKRGATLFPITAACIGPVEAATRRLRG